MDNNNSETQYKREWLLRVYYEYENNNSENPSKWLSQQNIDPTIPVSQNLTVKQFLGGESAFCFLVSSMRGKEIFVERGTVKVNQNTKEQIEETLALFGQYPLKLEEKNATNEAGCIPTHQKSILEVNTTHGEKSVAKSTGTVNYYDGTTVSYSGRFVQSPIAHGSNVKQTTTYGTSRKD